MADVDETGDEHVLTLTHEEYEALGEGETVTVPFEGEYIISDPTFRVEVFE